MVTSNDLLNLDDESESCEHEKDDFKNKTHITFLNTNARSLCPKIDWLIDSFNELDASFSVITETWLSDGDHLQRDIADLENGAGLAMLCRNRPPNSRGVSHGEVAVIYRKTAMNLKEIDIGNTDGFEILGAMGNIRGHARKILVLAVYMHQITL